MNAEWCLYHLSLKNIRESARPELSATYDLCHFYLLDDHENTGSCRSILENTAPTMSKIPQIHCVILENLGHPVPTCFHRSEHSSFRLPRPSFFWEINSPFLVGIFPGVKAVWDHLSQKTVFVFQTTNSLPLSLQTRDDTGKKSTFPGKKTYSPGKKIQSLEKNMERIFGHPGVQRCMVGSIPDLKLVWLQCAL